MFPLLGRSLHRLPKLRRQLSSITPESLDTVHIAANAAAAQKAGMSTWSKAGVGIAVGMATGISAAIIGVLGSAYTSIIQGEFVTIKTTLKEHTAKFEAQSTKLESLSSKLDTQSEKLNNVIEILKNKK